MHDTFETIGILPFDDKPHISVGLDTLTSDGLLDKLDTFTHNGFILKTDTFHQAGVLDFSDPLSATGVLDFCGLILA